MGGEIEALFNEIDANRNGFLVGSELKDFISKYEGQEFDEELFFAWFDVHGAATGAPDGQLDLKEFGCTSRASPSFIRIPRRRCPSSSGRCGRRTAVRFIGDSDRKSRRSTKLRRAWLHGL